MLTLKPISCVLNHAIAYRLWQLPFVRAKFRPILEHNDLQQVGRVLDVGCGPGTNRPMFPAADYVGLDHNPRYIQMARRLYGGRFLVGDARSFAAEKQQQFDFILLNSLLHHIQTADLRSILRQVHDQLTPDGHVHILDLVLPEKPSLARFLARSDRGDYPRRLDRWRELFCDCFAEQRFEPYVVGCCGLALWNMVYFKGSRKG